MVHFMVHFFSCFAFLFLYGMQGEGCVALDDMPSTWLWSQHGSDRWQPHEPASLVYFRFSFFFSLTLFHFSHSSYLFLLQCSIQGIDNLGFSSPKFAITITCPPLRAKSNFVSPIPQVQPLKVLRPQTARVEKSDVFLYPTLLRNSLSFVFYHFFSFLPFTPSGMIHSLASGGWDEGLCWKSCWELDPGYWKSYDFYSFAWGSPNRPLTRIYSNYPHWNDVRQVERVVKILRRPPVPRVPSKQFYYSHCCLLCLAEQSTVIGTRCMRYLGLPPQHFNPLGTPGTGPVTSIPSLKV